MFNASYFAPRYFAPRYWPKIGADAAPVTSRAVCYIVAAEDRAAILGAELRIAYALPGCDEPEFEVSMADHLVSDDLSAQTGTAIVLTNIPTIAFFLLFRNGQALRNTVDYTRSGKNVTLVLPMVSGETLIAAYVYL